MNITFIDRILRIIAGAVRIPVVILLLLFLAFSLYSLGWIIAEGVLERRHVRFHLPHLLDTLQADSLENAKETIRTSGILPRHKQILLDLLSHPEFDSSLLDSLSNNLLEQEQNRYAAVIGMTDLITKLAPMAGLLGTLIPLGPGIIALGQGDVRTLSASLLTAFDTTVIGLLCAGICLVISSIRRRWYAGYMADLETLADCLVGLACGTSGK